MGIRELNLTKEQHEWLNGWLELWGAWVYSGRLEKRMSSVIAKFMESVEPGRVMTRPMCTRVGHLDDAYTSNGKPVGITIYQLPRSKYEELKNVNFPDCQ